MENLRTTFIAALALGIVDQAAFYRTHDEAMSNMILFLVILGTLLLRRRAMVTRSEELEGGSWQAVKEIRPVPRELRDVGEVKVGFRTAAALVLGLVILVGLFAQPSWVTLVSLIFIYAIVGLSLVILTGWAGQISLGQFAFVAVGAAVCSNLVITRGFNLLAALALSGLVGAVLAVLIGLPALRIRGLLLAASTIAFGLFVSSMVLNRNYFPWLAPLGRFERPSVFGIDLSAERSFFFLVLILALIVLYSVRSLRRSRIGRVLIGARDNERAVRAFGVNVTAARLAAFAISGFFAAVAGALYAMHQNTVIASAFGVEKSQQVFVMVVIGGLGSVPGALFGAAYFFVTQYVLRGAWSLLASGFGMLVLLMILPGGIGQLIYGWRDGLLRWIAKRRKIIVPSLVADVGVDQSVLLPGARAEVTAPIPASSSTEPVPVSGGSE
jgi:branched-chain amino acid transport system permease protein